jgi:hypothetical protein
MYTTSDFCHSLNSIVGRGAAIVTWIGDGWRGGGAGRRRIEVQLNPEAT